ncbi:MAG: GxxExxY protein [Bacteroidetes bacterium]|nr:GxxExxY protein [Bacteroidota bacterium]
MNIEHLNIISYAVIGCAYSVHSNLGPGLLESVYEHCLAYEITQSGRSVRTQLGLPLIYKSVKLDIGYRIDILVDDELIIEVKSVDEILEVHEAQLLTYLRLTERRLGLILNFNVTNMQRGIRRVIR